MGAVAGWVGALDGWVCGAASECCMVCIAVLGACMEGRRCQCWGGHTSGEGAAWFSRVPCLFSCCLPLPAQVTDQQSGATFSGASPTKPWTEVCIAHRTGQRISGPLFFGFSDPLTQRAIAVNLYNDQELQAALQVCGGWLCCGILCLVCV